MAKGYMTKADKVISRMSAEKRRYVTGYSARYQITATGRKVAQSMLTKTRSKNPFSFGGYCDRLFIVMARSPRKVWKDWDLWGTREVPRLHSVDAVNQCMHKLLLKGYVRELSPEIRMYH